MFDPSNEIESQNKKQQRIRCMYANLYLRHTKYSTIFSENNITKKQNIIINSLVETFKHQKKKPNETLVQMQFLKDSKMVILGYDKQLQRGDINFIDTSQGKVKDFFYNRLGGGVGGIQCFKNGRHILIADKKGMFSFIDMFKIDLNDIDSKRIQTGIDGIMDISLSPAQSKIVCGLTDKRCIVCDIQKERREGKFPIQKQFKRHIYGVDSVDWHPYKSLIVSSSIHLSDTVKLWDPHSEQLVHQKKNHKSIVSKVKFHPQGNTYFSLGKDNMVIQNELRKRGAVNKFQLQFEPTHLQVLNNRNIVIGDNGGFMNWFTPTGETIGSFQGISGVSLFAIDQTNNLLVLGRERQFIFQIYTRPDAFEIMRPSSLH